MVLRLRGAATSRSPVRTVLPAFSAFAPRHIGPSEQHIATMLARVGQPDLESLVAAVVPDRLRTNRPLGLPPALAEHEMIAELSGVAAQNRVLKSMIGAGYHDTLIPAVIRRNILENPGWYTQYTPYQAEIAQGRLEALLNFQTLVTDLTGLPCANASLLDEATAAAEAMHMSWGQSRSTGSDVFFVASDVNPQTLDVVRTRALPLGIEVLVGDPDTFDPVASKVFGVLVANPATDGTLRDFSALCEACHTAGALVTMIADPLSLVLLRSPGEMGADIAVGTTQRFGVPMGYGGPHAAYMATKDAYKRAMPGRIVGVSVDATGRPAIRLALQTREQHIRREKATSNICTAQVLLAVIASMYAVYHGPDGLRQIALRVYGLTLMARDGLRAAGHQVNPGPVFDTVTIETPDAVRLADLAEARGYNLRRYPDGRRVGLSFDETTTLDDVHAVLAVFGASPASNIDLSHPLGRVDPILSHPVFALHHSETEMQRYIRRLEARDLSLTTSMIPLGSCTMKLNAASEMLPITWPQFGGVHPFAPLHQVQGYQVIFRQLSAWLEDITGFSATSLQPNAGSQGEYAGLLCIQHWQAARGQGHRNVCLIPASAHGTNPASAAMVGLTVVVVQCDRQGNIDLTDLRRRAAEFSDRLSCLMVTYPSTHGVFEEEIRDVCQIIHEHGGRVYMDGANLNALVGLVRPAELGADVCHINLHKTFAIPHGGGGPGMGPICCTRELAPYLPGHGTVKTGGGGGAVSAAPWGSADVLLISWAYMRMMGPDGLRRATEIALLNANYIAKRLAEAYPTLYTGKQGYVAHECILECRHLKAAAGIEVEDIAKRLIDYGFHAPTVSFPVVGTLMVEPTESEDLTELDRFCDALLAIREEIRLVEEGVLPRDQNPLKLAPHTAAAVTATEWNRPYSRETAAFPAPWTRAHKFWPPVARINNPHGDRNLICTCPPLSEYS